ncbi:hypothetical protein FJY93_01970 [Candidatus Kaiserbacteria bacterium]|nr:hypothetical protein [Candidatus Kaiserbacteria bacterium]
MSFRLLINVLAICALGVAVVAIFDPARLGIVDSPPDPAIQTATVQYLATPSPTMDESTTTTPATVVKVEEEIAPPSDAAPAKPPQKASTPAPVPKVPAANESASDSSFEITRIVNPYPTPALHFDEVNVSARAALVNILCIPKGGASLRPISGSGVIIDPRGVILTNAHVAQYVLLSQSQKIDLSCLIRIGSPARALWTAEILFIPPVWVNEHIDEINTDKPMGTGEHDYALLRVTGSTDNAPLPQSFPFLPFDTREVIGFLGDFVLGAAYPAEFVGGLHAHNNLFAASSVSKIDKLLTFHGDTVDMISIGGVIEAQSGSSGGAVVNAWNKLIGLITTTSEGKTTADRTLHATMMSYINRDLKVQTGQDLATYLQGDLAEKEAAFDAEYGRGLFDLYLKQITK